MPEVGTREEASYGEVSASAGGLRVGAVDVGSNAIRFLVADVAGGGRLVVAAALRAPIRLGHEVFLTGRLTEESMAAAVGELARYRELAGAHGVGALRAVATSAVRESRNRSELVARVREEAGLDLEVISGAEEARLVHLAVRSRIELGDRHWMLADLGGGSVEVSLVDGSGTLWSESHTIGSVRLLEELSHAAAEPGRYSRLLAEYVGTLRLPRLARDRLAGFIATGGNIESLARLAVPTSAGVTARVPLERLRAVIATLARLSYRERVEELGLREDRADVILPAALVYERLCDLAETDEILVPFVGLKEGVVLDLADTLSAPDAHAGRRRQEDLTAAVNLGRRFQFDEAHGVHVAALAGMLFDELRDLHGLGPSARRWLLAAGVLHDVGQFVSYKRHHKHSLYLIANSELAGYAPREMDIVATVARYHRKGHPRLDHQELSRLQEEDRATVTKLAAILRVADALDREHQQRVRAVRARTAGHEVRLELDGAGDLLLETWSLRRRAGLFAEVYGRRVKIAG